METNETSKVKWLIIGMGIVVVITLVNFFFLTMVLAGSIPVSSTEGDSYFNDDTGELILFINDTGIDLENRNLTNANTLFAEVVKGRSPLILIGGKTSIVLNDSRNSTDFSTNVKLNGTLQAPTCEASSRGTIWFSQGTLNVADTLDFCMKTALNTYTWKGVNLI